MARARQTEDSGPDVSATVVLDKRERDPAIVSNRISFIGPLPPPAMLKQYDEACPGLAERIVCAFEKEGDHRRDMDCKDSAFAGKMIDARIYTQKWGMWCALFLGVAGLIVALVLALTGHPVQAGVVGGADVVTFGAIYGIGRIAQRKLAAKPE